MSLTLQQELFVKLYTTKGDTFGNGVLSYSGAYDYDLPVDEKGKIITDCKEYNACKANASRLLTGDNVRVAVRNKMLELFNEVEMDARVAEIAMNGQESNSLQAVKIFNELKQRITKKIDITSAGRPLAGLSDDELHRLAE